MDRTCNVRGKKLANFITSNHLLLHNGFVGPDQYTFESSTGQSVVDYIITDNITSLGTNWHFHVN
jgi:hypothetical protein